MPRDRRVPWDLVAVVVIQVGVLVAIAAPAEVTRRSGRDVSLRTVSADPYDAPTGYYVALAYEVERLPVGEPAPPEDVGELWLTVVRAEPAWKAVAYSRERKGAGPDEAEIRLVRGPRGFAIPNAGRYFIPEAERKRVADRLRAAHGSGIADLKVDSAGNVSVLRFRAGDGSPGDGR